MADIYGFKKDYARRIFRALRKIESEPARMFGPSVSMRDSAGNGGAALLSGVIVTESAPGEADNFEDNRYWVELGTCSDTGAAPLSFTGNGTVVEATNVHEQTTGWHGLRAGTQVALLRVGAGYLIL